MGQVSSRSERSRGCLLPGVVGTILVIILLSVFMMYSKNSKAVRNMEKEVEKAKSDSLVSAENSQECSKKLDGAEAEVRKKEAAIEKINKELAEKTSALAAAKQKEEELLKEKAKYE